MTKDTAGALTRYTYDGSGGLAEAVGPDATLTLERDAMGRVTTETVNGRTLNYIYDGNLHISREDSPQPRPPSRTSPTPLPAHRAPSFAAGTCSHGT